MLSVRRGARSPGPLAEEWASEGHSFVTVTSTNGSHWRVVMGCVARDGEDWCTLENDTVRRRSPHRPPLQGAGTPTLKLTHGLHTHARTDWCIRWTAEEISARVHQRKTPTVRTTLR